jgi:N-methylhydantoinase B
MTFTACAYALRALLSPDLPNNDGFYRLLTVVAPTGTIVNARFPAVPDRVAADAKGSGINISIGGVDPRSDQYFVFYECQAGGYGARATQDGMDAVQPHIQNTENSPVEETEAYYPIRILRYELIADSEGPGRFRGGLGVRRDYSPEGDVVFSVMAERVKFAPQGLAGGGPAQPTRFIVNPGSRQKPQRSKFTIRLGAGEVMSVQSAGGGGFGEPFSRDPELVAVDVEGGYISKQRARAQYGVVITSGGRVDHSAIHDG